MAETLRELVVALSLDSSNIAEVMSIAGQLGIENEHLAEFSRTMIHLLPHQFMIRLRQTMR